jgi:hypothetical protein
MSRKERTYLARISEADYPAFQALMKKELPVSFEDWQDRRSARFREYRENTIIDQSVDPARFKQYCDAESRGYSMDTLLEFAEDVAKDK